MNPYRQYYGNYDDIKKRPLELRFNKWIISSINMLLFHSDNILKKEKCKNCNGRGYQTEHRYSYTHGCFTCNGLNKHKYCISGYVCLNTKEEIEEIFENLCLEEYLKQLGWL